MNDKDASTAPDGTEENLSQQVRTLQAEVKRMSTLLSVGRAISWQLDLGRLLHVIMDEVTDAMEAERSTLFLMDWDRMELWSTVAQGAEEIRIPVQKGIAGSVAVTGETVMIEDAYQDPRFNLEVDKVTGFRTRSVLAVAVRDRNGQVAGVIEVLNKRSGIFTAEDQRLLNALAIQVSISLENAQLYSEVKRMFESFVHSLVVAIDSRHPNTSGHSARVREYSLAIAKEIGLSDEELELVSYAAILHDLGKIGVDDSVLKKPGKLTAEEFAQMRLHPVFTHRILSQMYLGERYRHLPRLASAHHERLDGTGYPEGLKSDQIPLISRIIAIADVFDALTCWREYRGPMDGEAAIEELRREAQSRLDGEVVEAFVRYFYRENIGERILEQKYKPPADEAASLDM